MCACVRSIHSVHIQTMLFEFSAAERESKLQEASSLSVYHVLNMTAKLLVCSVRCDGVVKVKAKDSASESSIFQYRQERKQHEREVGQMAIVIQARNTVNVTYILP